MSELKTGNQSLLNKAGPVASYLAALNLEQREAVEYGVKPRKTKGIGPLLIIAGAGSGKTKALTHRVAHLVANGADPHKIADVFPPGSGGHDATGAAHHS